MMTKNNFQKIAIRERMALTGEPYSVAAREIAALPTSTWASLDIAIAGGFQQGRMYLIGSRNGGGKGVFGWNLAAKLTRPNQQIAYVALELTETELMQAVIQADSGISVSGAQEGNLDKEAHELAVASFRHLSKNLLILDKLESIEQLRESLLARPKLKALVLDYLQLAPQFAIGSTMETRDSLVQGLKKIALELNIPVIVLAQLNRGWEQQPGISSFPSSMLISSADVVITLKRVEDKLNLDIVKNRQGALAKIQLSWLATDSRQLKELS